MNKYFFKRKLNKNNFISSPDDESCHDRSIKSISEELYKRLVLPFYILIVSLIGSSLVIEPKTRYFMKFHKLNIFLMGILIIIISQLSLKFFLNSINVSFTILLLPIILVIVYYILILIYSKFRLNFLLY